MASQATAKTRTAQSKTAQKKTAKSGATKTASTTSRSSKTRTTNKKRGKGKTKLTARSADKYDLYERSVQEPQADVRFLDRFYRKERGTPPLSLREDFCGTGWLCAEWVKSNSKRTALGIDLDPEPIEWGHQRHMVPLGDKADRVTILRKNVLDVTSPKVDLTVAFNFSYCIFQDRNQLKNYLQVVRRGLNPGGAFVLDIHGGAETLEELEESTSHGPFTYVWDQGPVNALTHCTTRFIHFEFRDGTRMRKAFTYDWRVWSLPEITDLLQEIGYSRIDYYWEGFDKNGEGNGVFRKVQKASSEDSWVAYVVAWK